jgi:hypothetical protein
MAANPAGVMVNHTMERVAETGHGQQQSLADLADSVARMGPALDALIDAQPAAFNDAAKLELRTQLNLISTNSRDIRVASDRASTQAKKERLTALVTTIPIIDAADQAQHMIEYRTYKLEDFHGTPGKGNVLIWLAKLMNQCRQSNLGPDHQLGLLRRHVCAEAAEIVETAVREGSHLPGCLRALEIRFARLQSPDSARESLDTLRRLPDEGLAAMATRIRQLAFMAARDHATPVDRRRASLDFMSSETFAKV